MYVIEVTPLLKATGLESLSYYSSTNYEVGAILDVPIRKKLVGALVTKSSPVSTAKTAVRAATFSLKKLPADTPKKLLSPILTETARQLQNTLPASLGAILFALLPKEIREGEATMECSLPCLGTFDTPVVSILQSLSEERYRTYRSKVREAFAHSGSVMFVVPTTAELEQAVTSLSQGIKERVVVLSSSLSTTKIRGAYEKFHDLSQAKLIITTPSHAHLDRHDITHIIIDNSRSSHYKSRSRPYIDVRESLKILAKITNRQVIFGDTLPRTEEECLRREDIYQTEGEHPKRLIFSNSLSYLVQSTADDNGNEFKLLSEELEKSIQQTLEARNNVFIYAPRRGLAPIIACVDCGLIVRCTESGAPFSLVRTMKNGEEQRWFFCPVSGIRVRAADTCGKCGSWRLKERGVGIQQIEDTLKEKFSDFPIFIIDHTTVTTHKQAKQKTGAFYDSKGAILLGTAMTLPYLTESVSLSAITSLDAARTIPTWRADEELFALLLKLREASEDEVLIQTRTEIDDLMKNAERGTVDQFYDEECELRESVSYPPFAQLIHFTFQGNKDEINRQEEMLTNVCENYSLETYAPLSTTNEKGVRYGLLKIPRHSWPDKILMDKLRELPPNIRIEINPHRII